MTVKNTKCSRCGGVVRRLGEPAGTVLCRRCLNLDDSAIHHAVRAAAEDRLAQRLSRFDTSGRYSDAKLPTAPRTRWERLAIAAVSTHAEHLATGRCARTGLVFIGPTGIGKTRALISIARGVGAIEPAGISVLTESELLDPSVAPWDLRAHVARLLANRHCILVDDIGSVARTPDQIMSGWLEVAECLNAATTPILFVGTTNRQSWSERGGLTEWMGAQSVSRLREYCEIATTGWTDHRTGQEHPQWRQALERAPTARP